MVKLESLKKENQFKLVLSGKKIHNNFFSVFAKKNSKDNKNKNVLRISFVMKKKEIGNAVKRNKIRRKLKAIVIKLVKIKETKQEEKKLFVSIHLKILKLPFDTMSRHLPN